MYELHVKLNTIDPEYFRRIDAARRLQGSERGDVRVCRACVCTPYQGSLLIKEFLVKDVSQRKRQV